MTEVVARTEATEIIFGSVRHINDRSAGPDGQVEVKRSSIIGAP
jgi:hypothetical protein